MRRTSTVLPALQSEASPVHDLSRYQNRPWAEFEGLHEVPFARLISAHQVDSLSVILQPIAPHHHLEQSDLGQA